MAISAQDIVKKEATQFATYLRAYQECSDDVQEIVDSMVLILADTDALDEDKDHATDVIVEALFPGLSVDAQNMQRAILSSPEGEQARKDLEQQEHGFADRIRELMEQRNLTQEQLAELTGVSQPAIANILTRRCRPQQRTVLRFAEAFDVDPGELWPELPKEGK